MGFSSLCNSDSSIITNNTKVLALESLLQQSIVKLKELVSDVDQLQSDSENYKNQYFIVKEQCESKNCSGAAELKKVIATKEQIIHSVASALTKLNETKNFNIITDVFKIIFEESPLTPPTEDKLSPSNNCDNISPKEEINVLTTEDIPLNEESLCEIDGTPTRPTSPIIHTKKSRTLVPNCSDLRNKKKCPEEWSTPKPKVVKRTLTAQSRSKSGDGGGRLRQTRLKLDRVKQVAVVDLTCSPEASGGALGLKSEYVQPLIKKESVENDDTILPSPTSGPTSFTLSKTTSKASPNKFKKPQLSLKVKTEKECKQDENTNINEKKETDMEMEESINILNKFSERLRNGIKKETPVKASLRDEDITHCETDASISLLDQVVQIEQQHVQASPIKRPLMENINVINTPPKQDAESSMSILRQASLNGNAVDNAKRKLPELAEPIYKDPTVRKKAEKQALPGWCCEQCKNFFGELYKHDPVMQARKINECSKHRGRHNPARPKTPDNFWNARWTVPEDTEELNRMNNAT